MKVECECGQDVQVPDGGTGDDLRCPHCGREVQPPEAVDVMGDPIEAVEEELPIAHDGEEEPLVVAIDPPPRARPVAAANGNGVTTRKQRDTLPLFLVCVGGALLVFVVVLIVANSGGSSKDPSDPNRNYKQQLDASAKKPQSEEPVSPSTGSDPGLFPNVRDNRTRADYERERQQRLNNGDQ